ncbi:MAG: hypothetical protein SGCHY_002766 [Lobulomycetales sp.]
MEFRHAGWSFESIKLPIASQTALAALQSPLPQLPEMLFLDSRLAIGSDSESFSLVFDAKSAMACVATVQPSFQVAPAETWLKTQSKSEIKDVIPPFDWTFTPMGYQGHISAAFTPSEKVFNVKLLSRTDTPILHYSHIVLYEDEVSTKINMNYS